MMSCLNIHDKNCYDSGSYEGHNNGPVGPIPVSYKKIHKEYHKQKISEYESDMIELNISVFKDYKASFIDGPRYFYEKDTENQAEGNISVSVLTSSRELERVLHV